MLVLLEIPWSRFSDASVAQEYLRRSIRDSVSRSEIPWSPQAIFCNTKALLTSDIDQAYELYNIKKDFILLCKKVVLYRDYGLTDDMKDSHIFARIHKKPVEFRKLSE